MEGPVDSDFGTRIHFHADSKVYIVRFPFPSDGVTFLSFYFFVSACFIVSLNIQTLRSYINLIVFFAGVCDFFGFVKESGIPGLVCHDLV